MVDIKGLKRRREKQKEKLLARRNSKSKKSFTDESTMTADAEDSFLTEPEEREFGTVVVESESFAKDDDVDGEYSSYSRGDDDLGYLFGKFISGLIPFIMGFLLVFFLVNMLSVVEFSEVVFSEEEPVLVETEEVETSNLMNFFDIISEYKLPNILFLAGIGIIGLAIFRHLIRI